MTRSLILSQQDGIERQVTEARTYVQHTADWNHPGRWKAEAIPPLLGDKWHYAVVLNNHTPVAYFDTRGAAELDAAKRNYARGRAIVDMFGPIC